MKTIVETILQTEASEALKGDAGQERRATPSQARTASRAGGWPKYTYVGVGALCGMTGVLAIWFGWYLLLPFRAIRNHASVPQVLAATARTGDIGVRLRCIGTVESSNSVFFFIGQNDCQEVIRKFDAHQVLTVEADNQPGERLGHGFLVGVDNQIDPTSATLKCRASLIPEGENLMVPGMFLNNIRLTLEVKHRVVLVPASVIQRGPEGTFVWVIKSGQRVSRRHVQEGTIDGEKAEIQSGLSPGEVVVTEGQYRLQEEGQKVRYKLMEQTESPEARPRSAITGEAQKSVTFGPADGHEQQFRGQPSQTSGGGQPTAQEIAGKSRDAYAALSSYSDSGTVAWEMGSQTLTTTFNIRLQRPNLYRIDWNQTTGLSTNKGVVWSDGSGDHLQIAAPDFLIATTGQQNTDKPQKMFNMQMALARAVPLSSFASSTIPGTFFNQHLGDFFAPAASGRYPLERKQDALIGGVDCYVVSSAIIDLSKLPDIGKPGTASTMFWIGKKDFLIHQCRMKYVEKVDSSDRAMDEAIKKSLKMQNKPATPEAIAAMRPQMIAIMERLKSGFESGVVSTQTHENIVVNQKFSPVDFIP